MRRLILGAIVLVTSITAQADIAAPAANPTHRVVNLVRQVSLGRMTQGELASQLRGLKSEDVKTLWNAISQIQQKRGDVPLNEVDFAQFNEIIARNRLTSDIQVIHLFSKTAETMKSGENTGAVFGRAVTLVAQAPQTVATPSASAALQALQAFSPVSPAEGDEEIEQVVAEAKQELLDTALSQSEGAVAEAAGQIALEADMAAPRVCPKTPAVAYETCRWNGRAVGILGGIRRMITNPAGFGFAKNVVRNELNDTTHTYDGAAMRAGYVEAAAKRHYENNPKLKNCLFGGKIN